MANGRFVSYLRVSTDKQGSTGLGIEAQRAAVLGYLNGGDWQLAAEYVEVESGRKSDRSALAAALAHCRRDKATLVIAKLDRLGRSVAFIAGLMESGVPFVACDRPHAKAFELHIYAAMAQEEARMIGERTKAALTAAKTRGAVLGGYRPASEAAARARGAETVQRASAALQAAQQAGCTSLRAIAAHMTAAGCQAPRGGAWTAPGVQRMLKQAV